MLGATTVLAACGGGGNDTSSFISQADGICQDRAQQGEAVRTDVGPVQDAQSAQELATRLIKVDAPSLDRLKALNAPSSASDSFQQYLSHRDDALAELRKGVTAAGRDDQAAYAQAQAASRKASDEADAVAAKMGLKACAEQLSADQEDAVRAVVVRTATKDDPDECTDDFTESFVKAQWGSVSACKKAQTGGAAPVESLNIKDVKGVDGAYAETTVLAHGGTSDGQTLLATTVYEGGSWKLDSVGPAAPST